MNKKVCEIFTEKYIHRQRRGRGRGRRRTSNYYSQFWRDLEGVKEIFIAGTTYELGEGNQISFWRDKWIDNEQLKYVAPKIYQHSKNKEGMVKEHYRRGSYRLGSINSRDFRIKEERNILHRKLGNLAPQHN